VGSCGVRGLSDRSGQEKDGGRGTAESRTLHFPSLELGVGSLFCNLDPGNQVGAVWQLPTVRHVLRSQGAQVRLHCVPIVRPVVVGFVQNQPDLEARIGANNADVMAYAQRHSLLVPGMLVAIKYRPDLVILFVGIAAPASSAG
jgi:hypothetical protein